MLELVFSEAAKHSMKIAMQNKNNPLFNDTKELVFIGPHLDIGDISKDLGNSERQQSLNALLNNRWTRNDLEKLVVNQRKEMDQLLRATKVGETIRIWKSNAAFSASAFAYVCYHLNDVEADIQVVSLKKPWHAGDDTMISYSHWGELASEEFDFVQADEEKLSRIEKESQADRWKALKEENSSLRAVVNGQLISVPEDFYDHLLLKHLPEEEFLLGDLIAEVLGAYPLGVSDFWYLYRIQKMIRDQGLEVVGSKNLKDVYQQRLQKI